MANSQKFCNQCGAMLPEDGRFCEQCGARVPIQQESYSPIINDPAPPPRPVTQQPRARRFPVWLIAVLSLLGILCIGGVLAGVYFIPQWLDAANGTSQPVAIQPTAALESPTKTAVPPTATPDEPTSVDGSVLFDFSTGLQGWPTNNTPEKVPPIEFVRDDNGSVYIQDEKYAMHGHNWGVVAFFLPIDFTSRRISFDLTVTEDEISEYGSFMLDCYAENTRDEKYTYFDFTPFDGSLRVETLEGTDDDFYGGFEIDLSTWNPPGTPNHIDLTCDEHSVRLVINNTVEYTTNFVDEQMISSFRISVMDMSDSASGLTILLDNVYVYENP